MSASNPRRFDPLSPPSGSPGGLPEWEVSATRTARLSVCTPAPGERYTRYLTRPGRVVFLSPATVDHILTSERHMARGDVRIAVTLACEECKRRNYQTNKSKRNNPDRITLRKYCRWCRSHTSHRETR